MKKSKTERKKEEAKDTIPKGISSGVSEQRKRLKLWTIECNPNSATKYNSNKEETVGNKSVPYFSSSSSGWKKTFKNPRDKEEEVCDSRTKTP